MAQAREGRMFILGKTLEAISEPVRIVPMRRALAHGDSH